MPAETNNNNNEIIISPFLGLQYYTEARAGSFFGRDEEIDKLSTLLQINTLTILFGKSGTGKTSLLNAGVFPRLRKNYCLPFRIRLEFNEDSPDLVSQIKKTLKQEIDKYGFQVEAYPGAETLWEYFHKEPLWKTVTPILVFDQFEEIFTLAKLNARFGSTDLPAFWRELSDVIENNIPEKLRDQFLNNKEAVTYNYKKQKTKILFAFREEYLPEFESITSKIPSIKYSRFRLMPMNGNQAYEVITKSWKENIDPGEANEIVLFFTADTSIKEYKQVTTVEPSLLSQVCAYIDKARMESGGGKVSAELLNKYKKDKILRSIYDETLALANSSVRSAKTGTTGRNQMNRFAEENLINKDGNRIKHFLTTKDEIKLRPGINVLTTRYFLREDEGAVELTHDVLTPIIKADRDKRFTEKRKWIIRIILMAGALFLVYSFFQGRLIKKDAELIRANAVSDSMNIISNANKKKDSLVTEIDKKQHILDSLKRLQIQVKPATNEYQFLKEKIDSIKNLINQDSTQLDNILGEYIVSDNKIQALQTDADKLTKKVASLSEIISNYHDNKLESDDNYQKALAKIALLEWKKKEDTDTIISLRGKINALTIKLNNLQDLYDALKNQRYPPPPPPVTNFNMKLNLFYDYGKNVNKLKAPENYKGSPGNKVAAPGNFTIYLVPDSSYNKEIIKYSKNYDIRCDEYSKATGLRNAKGYKTATYYNGYYGFANVAPGKYLIKICTYYGGYYLYTKKSDGVDEVDWNLAKNAAPAIR